MDGVHIQTLTETAEHAPQVARLTVRIWPLPAGIVPGLAQHVQDAANAYLRGLQLVSGEITDLTGRGPTQ